MVWDADCCNSMLILNEKNRKEKANQFELESKCGEIYTKISVQYPTHKILESACGGSRGLLWAIKASFDLRLPLGSASALG